MHQATEPSTHAAVPDGPVPLTADAVNAVAPTPWTSAPKRKHSPASSVATIHSTGSRDIDMTFSDSVGPYVEHEERAATTWHQEFASPTSQSNRLGDIVESLEKCRTNEVESPVLGRRELTDQESRGPAAAEAKAPEMQERTDGLSPFMVNRPVEKPSRLASDHISLMDMDMEIETEHHEG